MEYLQGPEAILAAMLRRVLNDLRKDVPIILERPPEHLKGDYATNVALRLARFRRRSPLAIAEEIAARLQSDRAFGKIVAETTVAPPGFVNMSLSPAWLFRQTLAILAAGSRYGHLRRPKARKVQVEFISANPVGPLHLGNGRGGFLGDALANVLAAAGDEVTREYYVNDAGEQVRKLGWSVLREAGYRTPYDDAELYHGSYLGELASAIDLPNPSERDPLPPKDLVDAVARKASKLILRDIKETTRKLKIRYDVWFSERSLHRQGFVRDVLAELRKKRLTEEHGGAVWLKLPELATLRRSPSGSADEASSDSSEEVQGERVLVKSSGDPTYVLADLAYHVEKVRRRKFTKVIDIWGADHHTHAFVLSAGLRALGISPPDIILVQLVHLGEGGERVKMSKRLGTAVSLEWLVREVGLDVARWFFLERAPQSHMIFDLSLAKERSEKNPVFYVQYAHARCSSILRNAEEEGYGREERGRMRRPLTLNPPFSPFHESERALMLELVRLPDLVMRIAETYEIHQLTTYAREVATAFSAFYRDCRVLVDDASLRERRLALVQATKIVLANTLRLLGIRAPERM